MLASAVMPAHNRSTSVLAAIESVTAQTCSDLEVIVVDDGSTDDTARIAEEHARSDSRIHVLRHDRRRGVQATWCTPSATFFSPVRKTPSLWVFPACKAERMGNCFGGPAQCFPACWFTGRR